MPSGSRGRRRFVSLIYPDNRASVRVAEKVGMAYERDAEFFEKQLLLYSLLFFFFFFFFFFFLKKKKTGEDRASIENERAVGPVRAGRRLAHHHEPPERAQRDLTRHATWR